MHHKKKRTTSRAELRRLDQKSYRAAESRAIENGAPKGNPRTDRYSYRPEPLPMLDGICNGAKHGKPKPSPKKEKCPNNRVHEWYKEVIETEDYFVRHRRCDECLRLGRKGYWGGPYVYGCRLHGERYHYKTLVSQATCIHCWKVKTLSTERIGEDGDPLGGYRYWRRRTRRKIRTQDPVSGMTIDVR